ncbi:hypothetical protein HYS72_03190 [Candidatus Pacearchaeota archaeon]|nr:hypothetical protein [Candidatus Pacearchaeota archaeon]MBI2056624.1 hypothetical protein [Candidatus Pacearchaeota archaeon]
MKHIFILIGGASFGKTTIIKMLSEKRYSILNANNKKIFTITKKCSEQELLKMFCKYEILIDKRIKKLINIFERKSKGKENSALLIPFTIQLEKETRELGIKCIIEPFNYFKNKYRNNVHIIHLRREDKPSAHNKRIEINNFISQKTNPELTLISDNQQVENAEKLKKFIINKFI